MHFLLFFSLIVYFLHFYCSSYTYLSSVNYEWVVVREKRKGEQYDITSCYPPFEFSMCSRMSITCSQTYLR